MSRKMGAVLVAGFVLVILVVSLWVVPVMNSGAQFLAWRLFSGVPVTTGTAINDDVEIHYKIFGKGAPLVLLHGGLSSGLDWVGVLPTLSRQYKVIVVDLRGHGRSTIGSKDFSYRLLAGDLLATVDQLQIDRTDIVGWSDGGNVGLLFALQFPDRIHRLIAISANFHPGGIAGATFSQIRESPDEAGSWFARWLYRIQSAMPDQWPLLRRRVTRMWQDYPQLTQADLRRITAPTLLVVGQNDNIELSHAKEMISAIPSAELTVLPGVGHAVPRDAPAALLEQILEFLNPASPDAR